MCGGGVKVQTHQEQNLSKQGFQGDRGEAQIT